MKTLGLIGGMSWESSQEYYRILNELIKEKLGEPHSCELIMYSVDFAEFESLQHEDRWNEMAERMVDIARRLESAGAELLLICTNTMHRLAPDIESEITIPLLHIADATAENIKKDNNSKVGLLGTKFTMSGDFYKKRLEEKHEIKVITPDSKQQDVVHGIIYNELISGIIKNKSREKFIEIIGGLQERGAEGVILGCTEIPLLIKQEHSPLTIYDTTYIHARSAVKEIL
ncbi:MAG: aspartate/glutamate racemase family protein [Halanaerobiales bacterium]